MILDNEITVKAAPDEVFALFNQVERVAGCMPGATLDGQEGDTWLGRVKVKVGPITTAYSGSVRFLEVDPTGRRLRLQARGADTHGSGDAEAAVDLVVLASPEGAIVRLRTDLVIRGKIVQFGKGAIVVVSDRILRQFAQNLAGLLDQDRALAPAAEGATTVGATAAPVPVTAPPAAAALRPAAEEIDGLSMVVGPALAKYGPVAAAFAVGLFQGWLLGRLRSQARQLAALRTG
jgi:carbon monoxide dehydrogenase subunit G